MAMGNRPDQEQLAAITDGIARRLGMNAVDAGNVLHGVASAILHEVDFSSANSEEMGQMLAGIVHEAASNPGVATPSQGKPSHNDAAEEPDDGSAAKWPDSPVEDESGSFGGGILYSTHGSGGGRDD